MALTRSSAAADPSVARRVDQIPTLLNTPSTTLQMAVAEPMPSAIVTMAIAVNSGRWGSVRSATTMSRRRASTNAPVRWLREGDTMEEGSAIPGFSCGVSEIFDGIARGS